MDACNEPNEVTYMKGKLDCVTWFACELWATTKCVGGLELWAGLLTYGFGPKSRLDLTWFLLGVIFLARHPMLSSLLLRRMHRSTTIELQWWICDDEAPSDGKQQCQTPWITRLSRKIIGNYLIGSNPKIEREKILTNNYTFLESSIVVDNRTPTPTKAKPHEMFS